jgi:hypothetical protein
VPTVAAKLQRIRAVVGKGAAAPVDAMTDLVEDAVIEDAIEEAAQMGRESPLSSAPNVKQMLHQILEAAKH